MPTMHLFLFLHYLEIVDEHPDVVKELSVVVRNMVLQPGKLPLYLVVSESTYSVVSKILIGESIEKVTEVAVAELRRICDVIV
jgi:hypothetical protein